MRQARTKPVLEPLLGMCERCRLCGRSHELEFRFRRALFEIATSSPSSPPEQARSIAVEALCVIPGRVPVSLLPPALRGAGE
jgi:hypothetical protein